jgi:hypothetical protein
LQEDALNEKQMAKKGSIKKFGKPLNWSKIDEASVEELKRELTRTHVYAASLLADSVDDHNKLVRVKHALYQMAADCFGADCIYDKVDEYLQKTEELFNEMENDK